LESVVIHVKFLVLGAMPTFAGMFPVILMLVLLGDVSSCGTYLALTRSYIPSSYHSILVFVVQKVLHAFDILFEGLEDLMSNCHINGRFSITILSK